MDLHAKVVIGFVASGWATMSVLGASLRYRTVKIEFESLESAGRYGAERVVASTRAMGTITAMGTSHRNCKCFSSAGKL